MGERVVKIIQPRPKLPNSSNKTLLKRVAAYARVSTDSDEQITSIEAQKDYFEKLICRNPNWVFAGVYADEGISGTSLNHREAFNRMIEDAMNGKVDLIVTKSLSRFARNTVDSLNVIRKLKLKNVGVYFEKEDIFTLDGKGEFLITVLSSLAEEESRSISENVKWGHRKRFADGRYHMPYKHFLGYKKGVDGNPEIVEAEAKIIKMIYRLCLEGYSTTSIAIMLTDANFPTPAGNELWQRQTVESILKNEKYHGDALLQKRYCIDYRTKTMRKNEGDLPMYYVENGHEPIVTKDIFDAVQTRLEREHRSPNSTLTFAQKLYCKECGGLFTCIKSHSTTYNDELWVCGNHRWHKTPCPQIYLYAELLKPIFHNVINITLKKNYGLIRDCVSILRTIRNDENSINGKIIMNAIVNYDVNNKNENRMWRTVIEKVVIHTGHLLEFHLIDGSQVEYQMGTITPRRNRLSEKVKQEILDEHKQGKCAAQIAREKGLASSTVRSIIDRENSVNNKITGFCPNCGKEFTKRTPTSKYCSSECYRQYRFGKK